MFRKVNILTKMVGPISEAPSSIKVKNTLIMFDDHSVRWRCAYRTYGFWCEIGMFRKVNILTKMVGPISEAPSSIKVKNTLIMFNDDSVRWRCAYRTYGF